MICNKKELKPVLNPDAFFCNCVYFYSNEEMKHEENGQRRFRILIR